MIQLDVNVLVLYRFLLAAWHVRLKQYYPENDADTAEPVPAPVRLPQAKHESGGSGSEKENTVR